MVSAAAAALCDKQAGLQARKQGNCQGLFHGMGVFTVGSFWIEGDILSLNNVHAWLYNQHAGALLCVDAGLSHQYAIVVLPGGAYQDDRCTQSGWPTHAASHAVKRLDAGAGHVGAPGGVVGNHGGQPGGGASGDAAPGRGAGRRRARGRRCRGGHPGAPLDSSLGASCSESYSLTGSALPGCHACIKYEAAPRLQCTLRWGW